MWGFEHFAVQRREIFQCVSRAVLITTTSSTEAPNNETDPLRGRGVAQSLVVIMMPSVHIGIHVTRELSIPHPVASILQGTTRAISTSTTLPVSKFLEANLKQKALRMLSQCSKRGIWIQASARSQKGSSLVVRTFVTNNNTSQ